MVDDDELDRRALLRTGATLLAGAAITACGNRAEPKPAPARPDKAGHARPSNAALAAETEAKAKAVANAAESAPAVALIELTFGDLHNRLDQASDTAKSLVAGYRERIAALDQRGPMLRAVLELNPEADAIADRLDAERAAGKPRGLLHGLPILLKDNIDTGDQLTTTAGSLALEGSHAAKDAFVVGKLRAAGAIILGKANLSEWANFRGKLSSSGWSGRGGQCRNPYALDRSPSGSSSGSAVATAASLCAAAIGSETNGSIVSPASVTGLVGIKPTLGLVSRSGVIPLADSQDTLGPLARTVTDAAILLTVIAGPDPGDPATTAPHKLRPAQPVDYTRHLDKKALAGARLGVPRKGFFGVHRGVDKTMGLALADLRDAGAVLVDPVELVLPPGLGEAELEVLTTELKVYLDKYLASRGADAHVHSIKDVIGFNRQNLTRELVSFGQEFFEDADTRTGLTAKAYVAARAACLKATRDQLDKAMADHKLDAFVVPTGAPAWVIDPVNGDNTTSVDAASFPAIAGYPHITVPGSDYHGLPIGVSFFGAAFSEPKLIGYAYAYEQLTKHRRAPQYLATADEKYQQ